MRLFTGIALPEPILERLERVLARLRPTAQLRWSPVENLHITTKFIGEWPDERLSEVHQALTALPPRSPIPISVEGLGWMPNPHNPRVFQAGVHAGSQLAALAADTENALAPLGIPAETRPYSPHLTLARISRAAPLTAIRKAIEKLESVEFGAFEADRFLLYRSQTKPTGSVYTTLAEFELAG